VTYYAPGQYDGQITSQGFDVSTQKKTPFFWLTVDISADGLETYSREVRMYLTDKTVDRTIERLRSIGFTGGSFKDLEPGGSCSLVGTIVTLECKHEDG